MRRAADPWLLRLAVALVLGLAMPAGVGAAGLWTLVGLPLTAQVGVPTTFTLTATNEDVLTKIGCIEVTTTSNFRVDATAITNGLPWSIGDSNSHTKVTLRSTTSGGALGLGKSVVFTVTATPLNAGAWSWSGTAYQEINCGGSPLVGVPVVAIVVSGAAATPTPTPSPGPTAAPTVPASPSPTATPSLAPTPTPGSASPPATTPAPTGAPSSMPTAAASADPAATDGPAGGSSATSGPSPSPGQSATPGQPSPTGDVVASGGAGGAGPAPGLGLGSQLDGDTFIVSTRDIGIDSELSSVRVGMQPFMTLAVPAVLLGGPGLLLILAFIAQVTGALAWLPLVRRHMGERKDGRQVRFSRRSAQA